MYKAHLTGRLAEIAVIIILKIQLYKILTYRHRNHFGEIDIIALKNKTIFFIEVKSRSNSRILLESLRHKQIKRIKNAASYFMSHRSRLQKLNVRFYVYHLSPWKLPKKVQLF
jgi:putative endonuclease